MMAAFAVALLFGYALGAIPFGLLLTRFAGTADIRSIGSGNIGATNVLRTGNKKLAAATLLLDALKGTAAVLIAGHWGLEYGLVAGLGAFLGHLFPVWLGFKGGKGVATYIGVLLAVSWPALLSFAIVWLACAYLTRYASLSSLLACVAATAALWVSGLTLEAQLFLVMTILVGVMHRGNIERLLGGTEHKIGKRADSPSA